MNVDRATLKELLQEILTEEQGTSRQEAPVDPAAPTLKEGHHLPNPVIAARIEARRAHSEKRAKEGLPTRTIGVSKLGRVTDLSKTSALRSGKYLSQDQIQRKIWFLFCPD